MRHVTLLFAHGAGFCKETWDPILRHLSKSPVLGGGALSTNLATFDFKYHGGRRDESVAPKIVRASPTSVRVHHPAHDMVQWSSIDLMQQVAAIRAKQAANGEKHSLIGVGHSMGAAALWNTEVRHPGTFEGLVLFEPMFGETTSMVEAGKDFLVSSTLKREGSWPSREAAMEYFGKFRYVERWDRESLAAYLRGALVEEADGTVSLACSPPIEASIYAHKFLFLTDEELGQPKCKVHIHYGDRTKMFLLETFDKVVGAAPSIYSLHPPMTNASHVMVMEYPEQTAQRIAGSLAQMEAFQRRASM